MKKAWILFVIFLLMGCASAATVKQALIDLDEGYVENLKLMQQYRNLVENINERHRYWHRYARQRLLLNLALKCMTQDHWRGDAEKVDDTAKLLGDDLRSIVNELRLAGLAIQKGSDGTVRFEAGRPGNTRKRRGRP